MLVIRKAKPEDISQVTRIIRDSFHDDYAAAGEFYSAQQFADPNYATQTGPYCSKDILLKDLISDMKEKLEKPFEFFVACDSGRVEGFIVMENNNGKFWVNNMFVSKGHQREGVGKKLFGFASRGKGGICLWVNSKNPAVRFWERLGFSTVLQEKLMKLGNTDK